MQKSRAVALASIAIATVLLLAAVAEAVPLSAIRVTPEEKTTEYAQACLLSSAPAKFGIGVVTGLAVGAIAGMLGAPFIVALLFTAGAAFTLEFTLYPQVDKAAGCAQHAKIMGVVRDAQSKGTLEQLEAKGAEALNAMDFEGKDREWLVQVVQTVEETTGVKPSLDGLAGIEDSLTADAVQWLKASIGGASGAIA